VRPPRLDLAGKEFDQTRKLIRAALRSRPQPVVNYALPDGQ